MSQYDSGNQQPQQPQQPPVGQPFVGQPQYGQPVQPQQPGYGPAPAQQWGAAPQPPAGPPKKTNVTLIVAIILGVVVVALVVWIIVGQVNKPEPVVTPPPVETSQAATSPSPTPTQSVTSSQTPPVTPSPSQTVAGGAAALNEILLSDGGATTTDPEVGHTFTVVGWVESFPVSEDHRKEFNMDANDAHIVLVHVTGTSGDAYRYQNLSSTSFRLNCGLECPYAMNTTDIVAIRSFMEAAGYTPWPNNKDIVPGVPMDGWIAFQVNTSQPGDMTFGYQRESFLVRSEGDVVHPEYLWSVALPKS